METSDKNSHNAMHKEASDEISHVGDGISHDDIPKNISSKEKVHKTTSYIRFANGANTGNSKMSEPIKTIEPATTFFDDGKFIRILTELPGMAEEKIRIDLDTSSSQVTIVASDTVRKYKKVINIPFEVKFGKKRFSDGVLELILGKNQS